MQPNNKRIAPAGFKFSRFDNDAENAAAVLGIFPLHSFDPAQFNIIKIFIEKGQLFFGLAVYLRHPDFFWTVPFFR